MGSSIENEKLRIKQDVDIWSLGCVLSVFATWVVYNWSFVQEYSEQRRSEVKNTGRFKEEEDCFHNGKDELLNCVDQNHNELAQSVRPRDYVTRKVLKMIKDDMLRPSQLIGARRSAIYLCHEVDKIIREAEEEVSKATQGAQSLTARRPDNSPFYPVPVLISPEPPGHTNPLNYNPPLQSPYQSETIRRRPFFPESSFTTNGQTHYTPRGRMDYEHSVYQPTCLHEDGNASNMEPTMSGLGSASALPHPPSSRYPQRKPTPLALSQREAEDPFILTYHAGGTLAGRLGHRMSDHENESLPVPGSSPAMPELNLRNPSHVLGTQNDKPLPVWQVEDAQKWKRIRKDPKNSERIHIPGDNNDLERLKGRDHVRMPSSTFYYLLRRVEVFLIDNASSMKPYWWNARELLGLLFYLVKRADPDGVDLHFTSPAKHYKRIKKTADVLEIFDQHKPRSQSHCDMSFHLSSIVNEYQRKLTKIHGSRSIFDKIRSQETRPLSLYIFTDAIWQPRCDVAPVVKSLVNTINQQNLLKQQAGIQFIRFGDSKEGMKRLQDLDNLMLNSYVNMYVTQGYLLLTPPPPRLAPQSTRSRLTWTQGYS